MSTETNVAGPYLNETYNPATPDNFPMTPGVHLQVTTLAPQNIHHIQATFCETPPDFVFLKPSTTTIQREATNANLKYVLLDASQEAVKQWFALYNPNDTKKLNSYLRSLQKQDLTPLTRTVL